MKRIDGPNSWAKADERDQELRKDAGKNRWELLPLDCIEGIVEVLTFGATKYADNGWKDLMSNEEGAKRTVASLLRHLLEIERHGIEAVDAESGLKHIDHLQCNAMFLKFWQLQKESVETPVLSNGMRHDETLGQYIERNGGC